MNAVVYNRMDEGMTADDDDDVAANRGFEKRGEEVRRLDTCQRHRNGHMLQTDASIQSVVLEITACGPR